MLVGGCTVLGVGVALLLAARLGSDGYSTFISGLSRSLDVAFWVPNLVVGVVLVLVAAWRGVRPGVGTIVQLLLVGPVVSVGLAVIPEYDDWLARGALLVVAFPVLALGIVLYLGAHLGAGPTEGAALAFDPPVRFAIGYNLVQGTGAVLGFLLGADVGIGTVAVIVLLGPLVEVVSRLIRVDVHQTRTHEGP